MSPFSADRAYRAPNDRLDSGIHEVPAARRESERSLEYNRERLLEIISRGERAKRALAELDERLFAREQTRRVSLPIRSDMYGANEDRSFVPQYRGKLAMRQSPSMPPLPNSAKSTERAWNDASLDIEDLSDLAEDFTGADEILYQRDLHRRGL